MALFDRPLKRARALFSQLFEPTETRVEPTRASGRASGRSIQPAPRSSLLEDPRFSGVGASRDDEGVLLSWRTTDAQLRDASALMAGARSLRIVLVREGSDANVEVDTLDLGEVAAEGARLLPEVPGLLRAVASIGLFDGARFVSMAHGSVA